MEPDSPPQPRRSSILKVARPAPPRSPLQCLETNQDAQDEDRTTVTRSFKRRVSFSRTNKVQEFCLENPQTWGETYEKALSPEPPAVQRATIPFEPSGSLQDLLRSEIKSAPQFIQSVTCTSTSETFKMSYEVSQTVNSHKPCTIVTSAPSVTAEGSDDDMDITAPNVVTPSFVPAPQVKTTLEVDKENLVAKLMPDYMRKSFLNKTTSSAMNVTSGNLGLTGNNLLSMGNFPNVYLEPDDYENSPIRPVHSVLDQTRIEDSSMEMSTCSMANESNNELSMNNTYGKAEEDLINKSLKMLNQTTSEACNMDITEHMTKTSVPVNLNASKFNSSASYLNKTGVAQQMYNETQPQVTETLGKNELLSSTMCGKSTIIQKKSDTSANLGSNYNNSQIGFVNNSTINSHLELTNRSTLGNQSNVTHFEMSSIFDSPPATTAPSMNITIGVDQFNISAMPQNLSNVNAHKDNLEVNFTKGIISNELQKTQSEKSIMDHSRIEPSTSMQNSFVNKSMMDITRGTTPNELSRTLGEKSMMDITRGTTPNELSRTLGENSMMDITRGTTPNELQKTLGEKSMMDITRGTTPNELSRTLGEKSMMDITRVTTPNELSRTLGEKSMMDVTRGTTPNELSRTLGEKSMMDITRGTTPNELSRTLGEKSMIDITRGTTPNELQKTLGEKSMMDITRGTTPNELSRTLGEKSMMDITRGTTPNELSRTLGEKSMMDITRGTTPNELSRTLGEKSMMDITRGTTPNELQKTLGEKSMMDITRGTTPNELSRTLGEKSMMDITRVTTPSELSRTLGEKSMMDITRGTTPNELSRTLGEKSMMDITRGTTPNELSRTLGENSTMDIVNTEIPDSMQQSLRERSLMNVSRGVAPIDVQTTLCKKSAVDISNVETSTSMHQSFGNKSILDITRGITPSELQKTLGEKSMIDDTKTGMFAELHLKAVGEMDITRTISPDPVVHNIMDITRTISPAEDIQYGLGDKSLMNVTRTVSPDDQQHKFCHEKSMMNITRTISPDVMIQNYSTVDEQLSKTINKTTESTVYGEHQIPSMNSSNFIQNVGQVNFNDSVEMDVTEFGDNFKTPGFVDQVLSKSDSGDKVDSPNLIEFTSSTITEISSPSVEKYVSHEKRNIIDKIANETCEIENYKVIETRKDPTSSDPNSKLLVDKYFITEDIEDVNVNEMTGTLSQRVKHLELTETIESHTPSDQMDEPESQGTKIELNSRQELFLSPVVADKSIDVATLITRSSTSPVVQKLTFDSTSPNKKSSNISEEEDKIEDDTKVVLKRHSTSFEDEVTSNKKNCQETIENETLPEILINLATPQESVVFEFPDVNSKKTKIVTADIHTDAKEKGDSDMDLENSDGSPTTPVNEDLAKNSDKRQLASQYHQENQQVKKARTYEREQMEIETKNINVLSTIRITENKTEIKTISPEPAKPLTIVEKLSLEIKGMRHVWRVQGADASEWQLITLRGAALLTLKLQKDGKINHGHFEFNPAGITRKQKGCRVALQFCYSLLQMHCPPEELNKLLSIHTNPIDLLKQLYPLLQSLTTLAIGLERAATSYLLEFHGTRVKFSARSLQLLLRLSVSIDLAKWNEITVNDVTVTVHSGSIRKTDIFELLCTIPRNSNFIPKLIEVVREYIKTLEQCCGNMFNQSLLR